MTLKPKTGDSSHLFLSATDRSFLPPGATEVDQLLPRRIVRLMCQIIVGTGQFTAKDGLLSTMSTDRTATLFMYLGIALRADQRGLKGKRAQPDERRNPTQLPHIVGRIAGSQALSCRGVEISLFSAVTGRFEIDGHAPSRYGREAAGAAQGGKQVTDTGTRHPERRSRMQC